MSKQGFSLNKQSFSLSKQSFSLNKKILLVLWVIFMVTHLINILEFPIFEDEAEYLILAQQVYSNPIHNLLIYPFNGLLPMFGWLVPLITIFTHDTLLGGRLLNVLLASTLIFWIDMIASLYGFNKRFRYIAIILLVTSPFLFLNARMGLLDTSILVFTSWYIYFTAKLLKKPSSHYEVLGLFLTLIGAFLTKATAIFGIPVVVYLFFRALRGDEREKSNFKKVLKVHLLVAAIFFSVLIFYGQAIIADTGSSSATHLGISRILPRIELNSRLTWIWSLVYLGQFLLLLPFSYKLKKNKINELFIIMLIWAVTATLLMIIFNRFYYPRHMLSLTIPVIVIGAGILSEIRLLPSAALLLIMILIKAPTNYYILFNYQKADLALEDRVSYFEEYTSGIRINDVADKINALSQNDLITVWIDGSWNLEYGLRRQLKDNQNIKFLSYRLGDYFVPHDVSKIYKDGDKKTYVVVNRFQPPNKKDLELIENFKISFRQGIQIYQIK
ncbi:MAG: glycosyltransferase family 39 protein [Candidatus Daviesbacteria bacterium]|nr:glycosyltransferase family 39 protein [Candidatus Daviesbacteria bacterium]